MIKIFSNPISWEKYVKKGKKLTVWPPSIFSYYSWVGNIRSNWILGGQNPNFFFKNLQKWSKLPNFSPCTGEKFDKKLFKSNPLGKNMWNRGKNWRCLSTVNFSHILFIWVFRSNWGLGYQNPYFSFKNLQKSPKSSFLMILAIFGGFWRKNRVFMPPKPSENVRKHCYDILSCFKHHYWSFWRVWRLLGCPMFTQ